MSRANLTVSEARVLVNVALVAAGWPAVMRLPRGRRRVSAMCPLQNAMEAIGVVAVRADGLLTCKRPQQAVVIATAWGVEPSGLSGLNVEMPPPLQHFVRDWDLDRIGVSELAS